MKHHVSVNNKGFKANEMESLIEEGSASLTVDNLNSYVRCIVI
jgi:hypothetical protein